MGEQQAELGDEEAADVADGEEQRLPGGVVLSAAPVGPQAVHHP